MIHLIKDIENDKLLVMTAQEMIEEINRDRSDSWTPYDENDYLDGWNEWVDEYNYVLLV